MPHNASRFTLQVAHETPRRITQHGFAHSRVRRASRLRRRFALPARSQTPTSWPRAIWSPLVRVLFTCTAITRDDFSKQDIANYSANVELMEVIKGDVAKGAEVNIAFHEIPKGLLGPWSVFYYPGEMGVMHLVKDGNDYTTTWWNGRGDVVNKAVITTLPTTPGETVGIKRSRTREARLTTKKRATPSSHSLNSLRLASLAAGA